MKTIKTKVGLQELLRRYQLAGVTDDTENLQGEKGNFITNIRKCIERGDSMDEIDYTQTPFELRHLWKGLL